MKHNGPKGRHDQAFKCFIHLPQQMLHLHTIDNATEYVLHSLCHEGCLNLRKAAYFVDNPDFDCLQGVAGFNADDEIHTCDTVLDDAGHFKQHVNHCTYNKKVRSITKNSPKRNGLSHERSVQELAELLGMADPASHSWNIKHDNFGLLIYERNDTDERDLHDEFIHGLSILGFCPVS